MERVFIIDARRSAVGKFLGSLSSLSAPQIASEVVKDLLSRNKIDKNSVEALNSGIVLSAGVGQNPAKQVIRGSGLPDSVSTCNINMLCASGLRAIALSTAEIESGNSNVIIAGGMESMSNAPYTLKGVRAINKLGNISIKDLSEKAKTTGKDAGNMTLVDDMLNDGLMDCYDDIHMGAIAEKIGTKYNISREEQDRFALESHMKAAKATDSKKFSKEIVPIRTANDTFEVDEGIRKDTTLEKLGALKPAFSSNGTVTAGNSSQLSDGASFLLLISESKSKELGLKPMAVIESYSNIGNDPAWYGLAPTSAIKNALSKSGYKLEDVDLIELNEAFCVQSLGVVKELGIKTERLNVNGGATALGHPIGASGAKILTTLLYALADRNKKIGLAALCHGGGGAAAMVVRRL